MGVGLQAPTPAIRARSKDQSQIWKITGSHLVNRPIATPRLTVIMSDTAQGKGRAKCQMGPSHEAGELRQTAIADENRGRKCPSKPMDDAFSIKLNFSNAHSDFGVVMLSGLHLP